MSHDRSSYARTAWMVVALLWPVALLNYLDRQMLAAMKPSVTADIPSIATEANWGMLLAVFKWVYALLSPFGGYLADRYSKRGLIIGSLFVWSAVTWMTAHVESLEALLDAVFTRDVDTFEAMLVTRALMGISEAFYIPAALALIADFHAGPTRSRAVGVHQMAIYVGIIVGGFSGYAADSPNYGWRWAFSTAGLAGVLYTLPLAWLLPRPPQMEHATARPNPSGATRELLVNRDFVLLVLCFTLPALAGWVVKDWMPSILRELLRNPDGTQISQGQAGMTATLWVSLASLAGAFLGGWLADAWMRTHIRGRTFVSSLGMSLLIPALFGISHAETMFTAAAILTVFGIGWGLFDCNNMPILCQIVRPELRATGYGLMNLVSISCGGLADWGFGELRDRGIALPVIFGIFAAVAMVSVVLMLMIRPRTELISAESAG